MIVLIGALIPIFQSALKLKQDPGVSNSITLAETKIAEAKAKAKAKIIADKAVSDKAIADKVVADAENAKALKAFNTPIGWLWLNF